MQATAGGTWYAGESPVLPQLKRATCIFRVYFIK